MSDFWTWFDAASKAAAETPHGQEFVAAGFEFYHTGGGCTAWRKDIAGGRHVLITDDDGSAGSYADGSCPDSWLVGWHDDESGDYGESVECKTPVEAIAAATAIG